MVFCVGVKVRVRVRRELIITSFRNKIKSIIEMNRN